MKRGYKIFTIFSGEEKESLEHTEKENNSEGIHDKNANTKSGKIKRIYNPYSKKYDVFYDDRL